MERVARHVVCLTHDANYVRIERLAFDKRDDSCGHAGSLLPRSVHVSDDVEPKLCATRQDGEAQYRHSDYTGMGASMMILLKAQLPDGSARSESAGLQIKASNAASVPKSDRAYGS